MARRFNHLYGREADFDTLAQAAVKKMSKADAKAFEAGRKGFHQSGGEELLARTRALIDGSGALSAAVMPASKLPPRP